MGLRRHLRAPLKGSPPCAAAVSVVVIAREGHRRDRQVAAVLVRSFAAAEDRRSTVAAVNPNEHASPSRRATAAGGDVIADVIVALSQSVFAGEEFEEFQGQQEEEIYNEAAGVED
uniref:Uncharacterized protein n=1 Tax=Oryza sativa subsp. japonica TaxID=39947 RepID=Q94HN9_ORYSJ|nr:Hypothetical protein [Oryza sativa Japonica Group]